MFAAIVEASGATTSGLDTLFLGSSSICSVTSLPRTFLPAGSAATPSLAFTGSACAGCACCCAGFGSSFPMSLPCISLPG